MCVCVCVCVCVIFVIFLWEGDPPAHRDGRSQVDEDILHIGFLIHFTSILERITLNEYEDILHIGRKWQ